MSSAHVLRRQADLARLRELAASSSGRLVITEATERIGRPIRVTLAVRTVASERHPADAPAEVRLRFDLPARYPFERPVVTVESPIFHPNVFTSGVICQGEKWLPGDGLDILVKRIARLVTFDPGHVNPASAANRVAAAWYLDQRRRAPGMFPTDRLPFEANAATPPRVLRRCPSCGQGLRLPAGRSGQVECPACRHAFETRT